MMSNIYKNKLPIYRNELPLNRQLKQTAIHKVFNVLIIILFLTFSSFAQNAWTGEYTFGEDGGETAGGTKIYIGHSITITEKDGKLDAHISSQGFQTSRDIYADVKTEGDKIMFYFREKGEDDVRGSYEKGDLLLTLEKKQVDGKEKILTYWNAFMPAIESNEKPGEVYFERTKIQSKNWIGIESESKDFSLSLPEDSLINKEKQFFYDLFISGYERGVTVNFGILNKSFSKAMIKNIKPSNQRSIQDSKIGKFIIRKYNDPNVFDGYSLAIDIASNKAAYRLVIISPTEKNEIVDRFLSSVKVEGKSVFEGYSYNSTESKIFQIQNLNTSPEIIDALKRKSEKIDRKITFQIGDSNLEGIFVKKALLTRPHFVVDFPKPKLPNSLQSINGGMAIIKLRVEFLANGQIGDIAIINSPSESIAKECCIDAAKKIKFVPAQLNGKNESVSEIVTYNLQNFGIRYN